jgi:hypothetical protein
MQPKQWILNKKKIHVFFPLVTPHVNAYEENQLTARNVTSEHEVYKTSIRGV